MANIIASALSRLMSTGRDGISGFTACAIPWTWGKGNSGIHIVQVNERHVAGATYSHAPCSLLFLYKKLLQIDLGWIDGVSRPNRDPKRPTVRTRQEVDMVLSRMAREAVLFAKLLSGTGMRVDECAQLRVKDMDFQWREIMVREGKGGKDRLTMQPLSLVGPLREQINGHIFFTTTDRGTAMGVREQHIGPIGNCSRHQC